MVIKLSISNWGRCLILTGHPVAARGLTGHVSSCCPSTESCRAGLQGTQLCSSPGIAFIKHGFVISISLICFAKLHSRNFAYKPCGSSSHWLLHSTSHCCHKGQLSRFYGCQVCFLLKTSWFHGLNCDTQHRSGTWHCFMAAGWEMHSFPSSWNTRCCQRKQDWLIHPNLDYLSTNCRGRPDTELYSHFSVSSPFPPLFYCFFWLFLYWISGSFFILAVKSWVILSHWQWCTYDCYIL